MVIGIGEVRRIDRAEEERDRIEDRRLADVPTTEDNIYATCGLPIQRHDAAESGDKECIDRRRGRCGWRDHGGHVVFLFSCVRSRRRAATNWRYPSSRRPTTFLAKLIAYYGQRAAERGAGPDMGEGRGRELSATFEVADDLLWQAVAGRLSNVGPLSISRSGRIGPLVEMAIAVNAFPGPYEGVRFEPPVFQQTFDALR